MLSTRGYSSLGFCVFVGTLVVHREPFLYYKYYFGDVMYNYERTLGGVENKQGCKLRSGKERQISGGGDAVERKSSQTEQLAPEVGRGRYTMITPIRREPASTRPAVIRRR